MNALQMNYLVETEERNRVVAEALTWLGTPYVSNGAVKGAGVDCGMLLVRVFVDTGMVPAFDPRPYPDQWGLNGDVELYKEIVERFCKPVESFENGRVPLPGDIVLFKLDRLFVHGTLVVKWPDIIHSINNQPVCMDNLEASSWFRRDHLYYSLWPR